MKTTHHKISKPTRRKKYKTDISDTANEISKETVLTKRILYTSKAEEIIPRTNPNPAM